MDSLGSLLSPGGSYKATAVEARQQRSLKGATSTMFSLLLLLVSTNFTSSTVKFALLVGESGSRLLPLQGLEVHSWALASGVEVEELPGGRIFLCSAPIPEHLSSSAICRLLTRGISSTPDDLVSDIAALQLSFPEPGWALVTEVSETFKGQTPRPNIKTLLMALAQKIQGPPKDSSTPGVQQLTLIETRTGWLFGHDLRPSVHAALNAVVLERWRLRPFQFSAAMSLELAVLACSVLASMRRQAKTERPVVFFDPCVGTGTSLFAASLVFKFSQLQLQGTDVNAEFIKGATSNLRTVDVQDLLLAQHDSSEAPPPFSLAPNVVLVNLPWGENKPETSFGDNDKILLRTATALDRNSAAVLCVITGGVEELSPSLLQSMAMHQHSTIGLDTETTSSKKRKGRCTLSFLATYPKSSENK